MSTADDLLRRALECIRSELGPVPPYYVYGLIQEIEECLDAPKDEPVAWAVKMFPRGMYVIGLSEDEDAMAKLEEFLPEHRIPLYLHPPTKTAPMKPMTEEEINEGFNPYRMRWLADDQYFVAGVRFVEQHHGIGGKE